jgi:hypothetical protein
MTLRIRYSASGLVRNRVKMDSKSSICPTTDDGDKGFHPNGILNGQDNCEITVAEKTVDTGKMWRRADPVNFSNATVCR